MDFARKQLEKYGWSEGQGLGKNETGIKSALKPKLKFDNSGIGHNVGEEFTNNWWEKLFNSAAQNINIETTNQEVSMNVKDETAVEITTKSYSVGSLKRNKGALEYGSFVKTAKLTENGLEHYKDVVKVEYLTDNKAVSVLSDEQLLAACGGRTAHKGARHGLKLSGKLSRIAKQEKMLLKKMRKINLSDEKQTIEKKLKKIKKYRDDTNKLVTTKKKSSKKRKTVTFSETTTTKYYTTETDTSFDSELSSLKDENSNESSSCERESVQDEQSECESIKSNEIDDHNLSVRDLSKAERKRLKRLKRKNKHTATDEFLMSVFVDNGGDSVSENDVNLKKRKFYSDEPDYSECKRTQTETESPNRLLVKKNKKKKKKQRKLEAKQINSIVKSLDNCCRISDNE